MPKVPQWHNASGEHFRDGQYSLISFVLGLLKTQDDDGTGRIIPPAPGGHIVALMTR